MGQGNRRAERRVEGVEGEGYTVELLTPNAGDERRTGEQGRGWRVQLSKSISVFQPTTKFTFVSFRVRRRCRETSRRPPRHAAPCHQILKLFPVSAETVPRLTLDIRSPPTVPCRCSAPRVREKKKTKNLLISDNLSVEKLSFAYSPLHTAMRKKITRNISS